MIILSYLPPLSHSVVPSPAPSAQSPRERKPSHREEFDRYPDRSSEFPLRPTGRADRRGREAGTRGLFFNPQETGRPRTGSAPAGSLAAAGGAPGPPLTV